MNASTYLLGLYFLAAIMSCILLFYYGTYDLTLIKFDSVISHLLLFFLFLTPIISYGNKALEKFRFPDYKGIKLFSIFVVFFGILSIVVSSTKLGEVFSYDDMKLARNLHNQGMLHDEGSSSNFFEYMGGFGHNFSFFALLLYFYHLAFEPKRKFLIILLFISSFAIVLNNLTIMGRDGAVRWLIFFLFWFFFFRSKIDPKIVKKIIFYGLLGFIPIVVIFALITIARFGSREQNVLYYLIDYLGQPFINFSYFFSEFFSGTYQGRINFPILFGRDDAIPMTNLNDNIPSRFRLNVFPTFIGSFYIDLGFIGTFLLAFGYKIWSVFYFKLSETKFSFSHFVVYSILAQVFLMGIFYFMFYSPTVIKVFLLLYFIAIILNRIFKNKYKKVMYI